MILDKSVSLDTLVLAASILSAILGWFVQNWLEARRTHRNRVTKLRLRFLTETYLNMIELVHVGLKSKTETTKLAKTLNSAFLFGDEETVKIIKGTEFSDGNLKFGPILREIRNRVRNELQLSFEPNDPAIIYIGGTFKRGPDQGERFGPTAEQFAEFKAGRETETSGQDD